MWTLILFATVVRAAAQTYAVPLWRRTMEHTAWTNVSDHRALLISHGGDPDYVTRPYDSLASFQKATAEGTDCVKGDIRLASDGVAVVMHSSPVELYESLNCAGKHVENMTSEECTKCTMVPTLDQHFITVPEFLAWSNEKVIAMLCVKEPKNVRESIDALVQANATHRAFLEIHVNDLIEYVQDAMPVIPPSVRFLAEVGSLEEYEKLVNVTLGALHPALRARIWAAELDKGYEKWIPGGNVTVAIARDLHPLGIKTLTPTSSEVLPSEASQRKIYDKGFDAVYTYGTTAGVKARTAADKARGVSPP